MTVRVLTLPIRIAMLLAADTRNPDHGVTLMFVDSGALDVEEPFELLCADLYLRDCGCDRCGGWKGA